MTKTLTLFYLIGLLPFLSCSQSNETTIKDPVIKAGKARITGTIITPGETNRAGIEVTISGSYPMPIGKMVKSQRSCFEKTKRLLNKTSSNHLLSSTTSPASPPRKSSKQSSLNTKAKLSLSTFGPHGVHLAWTR